MTLREVTYYEVVCDDCGTKTGELGDFSAWSDHDTALSEWCDAGGWVGGDGETFCFECAPRCPICFDMQEPDGQCTCLDIAQEVAGDTNDQRYLSDTVREVLLNHYPTGMAVNCRCGQAWPCSDMSAALDAAR